eukprot:bmy_00394T0
MPSSRARKRPKEVNQDDLTFKSRFCHLQLTFSLYEARMGERRGHAHFHIMLVVRKQNQSIKEKERRDECVFFKSTSWGPSLQNSIVNQEDKHRICAFSLEGATGE